MFAMKARQDRDRQEAYGRRWKGQLTLWKGFAYMKLTQGSVLFIKREITRGMEKSILLVQIFRSNVYFTSKYGIVVSVISSNVCFTSNYAIVV